MSKTQAWLQFTKERFEPASHIVMIIVFIAAHILVGKSTHQIFFNTQDSLILFIGVTAFYFKLRLYDEVKDYELDVVINKTRPLPRGLLTHKDMYKGMLVCILIELTTFSMHGLQSSISIIFAIIYSLIMFKEFFIADKIRPYLTTYALVHTIVTTILSFGIFSFLTKLTIFEIATTPTYLSFAMANWMLFNIFEFGRKTFATSEERKGVDTYSSLFGKIGAVTLVASQALIAHYLTLNLNSANQNIIFWGNGPLLLVLLLLSLRYIFTNTVKSARNYRSYSSIYIVIFYIILIIAHLVKS